MPDQQGVMASLTRKFGPLPAWAWAGIAGGGIYLYRQHNALASAAPAPAADTANVPSYGQQWYGGGSGGAYGSSGGGGTDSGGGSSSPLAPPTINVTGAPPSSTPNPVPSAPGANPGTKKTRPRVGSSAGPKGAIVAPYGPHAPKNKPGFTTLGVGKGGWLYIPKKNKSSSTAKPKTSTRARSHALTHPGATRTRTTVAKKPTATKPRPAAARRPASKPPPARKRK